MPNYGNAHNIYSSWQARKSVRAVFIFGTWFEADAGVLGKQKLRKSIAQPKKKVLTDDLQKYINLDA